MRQRKKRWRDLALSASLSAYHVRRMVPLMASAHVCKYFFLGGGAVWFVGKDVAEILGYSNPRDALAKRVFEEDKKDGVAIRDSMGREQTPIIINESGLYSLILSSHALMLVHGMGALLCSRVRDMPIDP